MDRAEPHGIEAAPLTDDEKWSAVVACDRAFDSRFFYGVATTGVFCRPSCRARTPRRENVRFFASAGEAEARGFRPCKRCRPDLPSHDPTLALVRAAEELMRTDDAAAPASLATHAKALPVHTAETIASRRGATPSPADTAGRRVFTQSSRTDAPASLSASQLTPSGVAASLGVSPLALRRAFRAVLDTTPARHLAAIRVERAARLLLETDASVPQISLECGFESLSSFYKHFKRRFGVSPARLRAEGVRTP